MKRYERTFSSSLPRRSYTLIRLDGVGFRNYLRNSEKPFDMSFVGDMDRTALRLAEAIQGTRLAYVQSDEISLLVTDFDTTQTEPWYGGVTQKLVSVSASLAGSYFSRLRQHVHGLPYFDSRVWSMSDEVEVANYFVWRQRDAVRNSILMLGQHYFSQAQLKGRSTNEVQEMLWSQEGVNWNETPDGVKRGRVLAKYSGEGWLTAAAPNFVAEPKSFLADHIPPLPRLSDPKEA
jgi:tRNA(His) 5'-end guanylyltransferase